MRFLAPLLTFIFCSALHAQESSHFLWLDADGVYNDVSYTEAKLTEKGHSVGGRGELGLNLIPGTGFSVGGEYMDGHFDFDGKNMVDTKINALTSGYSISRFGLVHFFYGAIVLAGGVGEHETFENVVGGYRRREKFQYYPVRLTIQARGFYLRGEYDVFRKGTNLSMMSDISSSEKDVTFNQAGGMGYAAEIGILVPTAFHYMSRVFVAYRHWEVKDSDSKNDGVHDLTAVSSVTNIMQAGIGFSF